MEQPSAGTSPGRRPGDEVAPGTDQSAENVCPTCGGSGRAGEGSCPTCRGEGLVTELVGDA